VIPLRGLPRVVFVLGKGGVGRSTIAAALGTALARSGERVLVFEWALSEAIAPWFGLRPAEMDPCEVAPRLSVANFRLDDALEAYFVGHLRMGLFYRHVIRGRAIRRLVQAAPGIAEMMFLGHVCWLTTLAEKEAGLRFDRVLVDSPAMGHGASMLDFPATFASMHASGLLGAEMARVDRMMRDPAWVGALVVSLPEELAVEETLELVPRTTRSLGREPLAVIVNRSAARLVTDEAEPGWLKVLHDRLPPDAVIGLEAVQAELRGRLRLERLLRDQLEGATELGVFALDEQLALAVEGSPRTVIGALASALRPEVAGPA